MKKAIWGLAFAVALGVFAFSAYKLVLHHRQESAASTALARVESIALVVRDEDSADAPDLAQVESTEESAEIPTQASSDDLMTDEQQPLDEDDTSNHSVGDKTPISVDFDALALENPDIVAWIYCPDTPVSFPVVQGEDNDYYLTHLVDGQKNPSGSIFLDSRCSDDFSDINSIIYGHNMKSDAMFGSLTEYESQQYYDRHSLMYILTPEGDYRLELISGCYVPADWEGYSLSDHGAELRELLDHMSSQFVAEYEPEDHDRYVTLSTCSDDRNDLRFVLIGVLKEIDLPGN